MGGSISAGRTGGGASAPCQPAPAVGASSRRRVPGGCPDGARPVPRRGPERGTGAVESSRRAGRPTAAVPPGSGRRRARRGGAVPMKRAGGEGPGGAPRSDPGVPVEQVRDALAHLLDPGHLQTHPLAALAASSTVAPSAGRALRQALLEAVDALRTDRVGAPGARPARRHEILRQRYLEGRPIGEIQARCGISRRESFRQHAEALRAVASLLAERLGVAGGAARPSGGPVSPSRTNLPLRATSFVGREAELAEVGRLLGTARLLKLTGAGGCGKTRMAVEARGGLGGDVSDVWRW